MKKTLLVLSILALLFGFVGCNKGELITEEDQGDSNIVAPPMPDHFSKFDLYYPREIVNPDLRPSVQREFDEDAEFIQLRDYMLANYSFDFEQAKFNVVHSENYGASYRGITYMHKDQSGNSYALFAAYYPYQAKDPNAPKFYYIEVGSEDERYLIYSRSGTLFKVNSNGETVELE